MALADIADVISARRLASTVNSIAIVQHFDGCIPWFEGGHSDPWNHVEAAMALDVGGRHREAERAYEWLIATQHPDGSWFNYYIDGRMKDPTPDTNVSTYVAVGVWHHYLATRDEGFLSEMYPTIENAMGFALSLQGPEGEIRWAIEPDGCPSDRGLLAGSSSIYKSFCCAIAIGETLGVERSDWERGAALLSHAIRYHPWAFEKKDRWAMDWYYPVLCGVESGTRAEIRIRRRWNEFVVPGFGVRCVSDRPWITAAETCELVLALEAIGEREDARRLFAWAQHLRGEDGAYWTGALYTDGSYFPGDQTTYTSAAVILAADALAGTSPTSGVFRGEGLPKPVFETAGCPAGAPRCLLGPLPELPPSIPSQ